MTEGLRLARERVAAEQPEYAVGRCIREYTAQSGRACRCMLCVEGIEIYLEQLDELNKRPGAEELNRMVIYGQPRMETMADYAMAEEYNPFQYIVRAAMWETVNGQED